MTPCRSSSAGRWPPPRVSTCTSVPPATSPSASLRTCRASPPSTIGGYSQERIRTRSPTASGEATDPLPGDVDRRGARLPPVRPGCAAQAGGGPEPGFQRRLDRREDVLGRDERGPVTEEVAGGRGRYGVVGRLQVVDRQV